MERKDISRIVLKSGERLEDYLRKLPAVQHLLSGKALSFPADVTFSSARTHSPILMAYPGAQVLLFSEEGIKAVSYRETEHDQLSRRFLENPERMLDILLGEGSAF